jgi:hypothetical protein
MVATLRRSGGTRLPGPGGVTVGCEDLDPEGEGGAPALPDVPSDQTNV